MLVTSMAFNTPQDWAGLRALWRGVKRLGAVLAMAIVGAVCVGFGSAVVTAFAYCLGLYVGAPIGAGLGARLGYRMAPRDAVLVFVLALCGAWIGVLVSRRYTDDPLIQTAVWGLGYVLATLIAFAVGPHVPVAVRRPGAIAAAWGFGLFCASWVVRSLW